MNRSLALDIAAFEDLPPPLEPRPTVTIVTEAKKCPYCDKKLRKDNTRGACSKCLASGADKRADEAPPATEKKPARKKPEPAAAPAEEPRADAAE